MRSIIDNFVAALLNEEHETASKLLSQFIIAKAQDIHESLRQGEHPILSEDVNDDIESEHYFTDDDLSSEEPSVDSAEDTLAGELDADVSSDGLSSDEDEVASEEDASVDMDDRLDDLEAQLDDLTAEFERMMAEIDGEDTGEEVGDDDASEVMGADDEIETDVDGNEEESKIAEGDLSDDDFDDISEAIIDELEKIKTVNTDGREAGNKTITQNGKSLPSVRGTEGHPIKSKNVTHKGFERETAPSSDRLPKGINTQDKAAQKLKGVSKEGDASAELNKPIKQNNVSPVAKLKK